MSTHEHRRSLILRSLQFWDILMFIASLVLVLKTPITGNLNVPVEIHPTWHNFGWLLGSVVLWHFALSAQQVYSSTRYSGSLHLGNIVTGVSVAIPCLAMFGFVLDVSLLNLNALLAIWLLTIISMLITRIGLRFVLSLLRKSGRNLRFVVIVGSGQRASWLSERLREPSTGYRIIGYVDTEENLLWSEINHMPYLGHIESLSQVLANTVVDEVFVALPVRSSYDLAEAALRACEEQGVPVRMPYDLFMPGISTQSFDVAAGVPVLSLVASPKSHSYLMMKRCIDIAVALTMLILLMPMFLIVAIAIKMDSPGEVFFIQKRVGLNKRNFNLFKFRTMKKNSEALRAQLAALNEAEGPVFKIKNDPRITPLGHFLRKTSIDELPQLINVLLGDMSLVGPRPLPICDVEGFTIDWQRRRFSVRPGITCLWQISGRSQIMFDQWMALDMKYIDESSLMLDLRILLFTIPAVLRQTGAA